MSTRDLEVQRIRKDWAENPRWKGIKRGYTAEDVHRLRGSVQVEHDGGNVRKPVIDTSPDACIDQLANGVADALVMASNRSVGQTISGGR